MLVAIAVVVIIIAIAISTKIQQMETPQVRSFSKVITVGPVWTTNSWSCTSDRDFVVNGALRGLGSAQLEISIDGLGAQSLYVLDDTKLQSFTVGSPAGHAMTITRTGTITGWITMQTLSDATASCNPV